MNFKQLCEFVAEEVNGRSVTFPSGQLVTSTGQFPSTITDLFQRRVIRAVNKAYMDIQLHSRHWRFLDKRGALLNVRNGEDEYRLTQVQNLDWDSLYLTQSGTTARWPIHEEPYEHWQARERTQVSTTASPPRSLSRTKDPDIWVFWPVPGAAYILNGNLQYKPGELHQACDEPIWDDEYHDLVSWVAINQLESRVKTQDEKVSMQNAAFAQSSVASRFNDFCAQYLPKAK